MYQTYSSGTISYALPPRKPTLATLQVGDIIVDDDDCEYTVADAHGRIVELEDGNGHFYDAYTVKQLADEDFTVKGADPEVTELTLDEIAEKFNIPVATLKVKK